MGKGLGHIRVLPRDLFNDAKLLKCLGQLHLKIVDKGVNGLPLKVDYDGEPFNIVQNPGDGSLSCANYKVYLKGEELELFVPLNSKETYPLVGIYKQEEFFLFDEAGNFLPTIGMNNEKRNY